MPDRKVMYDRIRKNWEYRKVYRHGKALVSKYIVLYVLKNNEKYNRVGFSISKKIGKSVQRNRIKRVYLEAFRSVLEELKKGYDFIVVARKPAVKANFKHAREELLRLCRKGKIIQG